ncbi:MAG: hypothetical protein ACRBK7_23480 [Acidimicrobiales bacterium]
MFALTILMVLFAGRVAIQLVQWIEPVGFLPHFDRWQSGAVPYPGLLVAQLLIIATMVVVLTKLYRKELRLRPLTVVIVRAIGFGYLALMLLRLVAGLTFEDGHSWWDAPLPTVFHLVLASFILVVSLAGATQEERPT